MLYSIKLATCCYASDKDGGQLARPLGCFFLSLEFLSILHPLRSFICCPVSRDASKRVIMDVAIKHLLDIRAIQRVPEEQLGQGFYATLFVMPKALGECRSILDLKRLTLYIDSLKCSLFSQSLLPCSRATSSPQLT